MKNYFLPGLIWVLAFSQSFAQKTLSPSLKPYSDDLPHNVKNLLARAGFDLQATSTNKVSSRSPLQLDSTKTYYGYNQPAPGDSTPIYRSNFTYPSADTKVEISYQFENGGWQPLSRSTVVSDGQQRILTILGEAYNPDTQEFEPDSRLENFPHGSSPDLIDSFFVYGWDTTQNDWLLLLYTLNTFDAGDRLTESVSNFDFNGTQVLFKDVYSYDANGDNHLIEQYALFDGFELPSGRVEITYADHLPIEEVVFVSDGFDFYQTERNNYAYTLFGALRLHMNFDWNAVTEKWDLTQRIEYGFDGQQRVASIQGIYYAENGAETRDLITYAYIQDENLSLEMFFNWDDDLFDWVLDTKKHYYYNGLVSVNPDPGKALALQIVPNPTVDAVRLTLENEALVQVFSHSGQLLQSRLVQPGQMLNLVDLPAGIYQVMAQQGTDYYIGKVVKQ